MSTKHVLKYIKRTLTTFKLTGGSASLYRLGTAYTFPEFYLSLSFRRWMAFPLTPLLRTMCSDSPVPFRGLWGADIYMWDDEGEALQCQTGSFCHSDYVQANSNSLMCYI